LAAATQVNDYLFAISLSLASQSAADIDRISHLLISKIGESE